MKLKDVTEAINHFDKAKAACSYGESTSNIGHLVALLTKEDQTAVAIYCRSLAKDYLENATSRLQEIGIEVPVDPRPEEYRIKSTEK